jgi:dihydrofolate reductase/thymidylate synthase
MNYNNYLSDPPIALQKPLKIIAAVCNNNGIGYKNTIPWKNAADMEYFKHLTTTAPDGTINAVIMGERTWQSLQCIPLSKRINIVLTRHHYDPIPSVLFFPTLLSACSYLDENPYIWHRFVIGGGQLYNTVLSKNWSHELYLSKIPEDHECDVYFPLIPDYWYKTNTYTTEHLYVEIYNNRYGAHYEAQYLLQMAKLRNIPPIIGRNGPVHTDFQWSLTVDLQDGLPLFSTRRGFWRGICTELLFFIRGDTNSNHLSEQGITIWEGNTSKEFLATRKLNYEIGDMGPMYGWVWRHYGATYRGMTHDYCNEGYDQLRDIIHKLIHDPNDRRIMMTAYDPSKVSESVLAPCHSIVNHFFVRHETDISGRSIRFLDMYTYQRSADMFLGVYFNIPSDAMLQYIIARAVGMKPGKMYLQFGNNHIYYNHLSALDEQLNRQPNICLPTLIISDNRIESDITSTDDVLAWIDKLSAEDFKLDNYHPQKSIKADMVA